MPSKKAVINYQLCDPTQCDGGICVAVMACERKVLKQDFPYEKPDPPMLCVGCGTCVIACKQNAVVLMR